MRTAFEILLLVVVVTTTSLYFKTRHDNETLQKMAGYFSGSTRDLIDERLHAISERSTALKDISEKSGRPEVHAEQARVEALTLVMDSARLLLRNIDSLIDESTKATAYDHYKRWLTGKKSLFTTTSTDFDLAFNPVLGLNNGLYPESLITVKPLHATHLSTLILEDELCMLIYREVVANSRL